MPLAMCLSGVYPDLLGPSKGPWSWCKLTMNELRREAQGPGSVVLEGLASGADAGAETGTWAKQASRPYPSLLWSPPLSQGLSQMI